MLCVYAPDGLVLLFHLELSSSLRTLRQLALAARIGHFYEYDHVFLLPWVVEGEVIDSNKIWTLDVSYSILSKWGTKPFCICLGWCLVQCSARRRFRQFDGDFGDSTPRDHVPCR